MEITVTPATSDFEGLEANVHRSRRRSSSSGSSSPAHIRSNLSDNSYVGIQSGALLDFQSPMEVSTSVVLSFCRKHVLRHYFRLLMLVGWKPLLDTDRGDPCFVALSAANVAYSTAVFAVLVLGHLLQYAACFRRDGVLSFRVKMSTLLTTSWIQESDKTCGGSVFAVYLLPATLQVSSYIVALVHMRSHDDEQFQALMEKVFLQMTMTDVWHISKQRITQRLRGVYVAGIVWIFASIASQILNIHVNGAENFEWLFVPEDDVRLHHVLLGLLFLTVLFHDIVSMTIATTYAIHCQLVLVYLQHMCQAVREKRMSFRELYRGVEEARKSVKYLNQKQALGVTIQMMWLCSRSAVCIYALLDTPWSQMTRFFSAWLNVLLWLSLVLIPLFQACRLSSTCNHVRELGLELMARPFGYGDALEADLNTMLLFTSSLRMQAKLCALPVTKRSVVFVFLLLGLSLFIAVQLNLVRFSP
ncbi:unnamed protein product [Ixodes persulcatus]